MRALALVTVADVLRDEVADAFQLMDEIGIEPKIISGDNPATVDALVRQLGIELPGGHISGAELQALGEADFHDAVEQHSVFGRIAPEQKARIVTALRDNKHFVAMVGDGANDVRALRAADVAVAMESGTQTARAVAGIVLLNDSFKAFVSGTAEAQSVLGNSAQLSKLFITKSFYAFLIIIASDMLQLDFPFLPRHGSLTSLFTLGLPTMFIALTKPPPRAGADWTNTVLRFALPAAFALAAASVAVHLLTEGFLNRPIEDSRTLVSLTIGIVGIYFMVLVIGFDGITRDMRGRDLVRPRDDVLLRGRARRPLRPDPVHPAHPRLLRLRPGGRGRMGHRRSGRDHGHRRAVRAEPELAAHPGLDHQAAGGRGAGTRPRRLTAVRLAALAGAGRLRQGWSW